MNRFLLIAALVAAPVATPAAAEDGAWRVGNDQVHLYWSGIDTGTTAGRAALLARVERAAAKVCDRLSGNHRRRCVSATIRQTVDTSQNQTLALAMVERNGVALAAR
jgi:UrcA family protein